jgi:hypothetical protein
LFIFVNTIYNSNAINESLTSKEYKIIEIDRNKVTCEDEIVWAIDSIHKINLNNDIYENSFVINTINYETKSKFLGLFDIYLKKQKLEFCLYLDDYTYDIFGSL